MESAKDFEELFAYDYWANREALASLTSAPLEKALRLFAHIAGAQRVWLARAAAQVNIPAAEPWPSLNAEQAEHAIEELRSAWMRFLGSLTPEALSGDLVYRNSKGTEFRTPLREVLQHLILHSAYHRGQIASAVRESGGTPAATDYIVYVRQRSR